MNTPEKLEARRFISSISNSAAEYVQEVGPVFLMAFIDGIMDNLASNHKSH